MADSFCCFDLSARSLIETRARRGGGEMLGVGGCDILSGDTLRRLMSSHDLAAAAGSSGPLAGLSDDELVARARAHDVAAFEELVGRHEEKVYRLAMRFVRNE